MDPNESVGATSTLSPAAPLIAAPSLARVVLLDDDDIIADTLGRLLPRTGRWSWCGWAGSYAEFHGLVLEHDPHLALIDLDLRVESGFDAIERIAGEFPGVRSVVLSGYRRADYARRALAAGARGYIDKDESLTSIDALLLRALAGETVLSTRMMSEGQDSPLTGVGRAGG